MSGLIHKFYHDDQNLKFQVDVIGMSLTNNQ